MEQMRTYLSRAVGLSAGHQNNSLCELPDASAVASLLRRRRSVFPKDYVKGAIVSDEDVAMLVESANWAPTHGKTEPWRFTILATHSARLTFYELVRKVMHTALKDEERMQKLKKLDTLIAKKEPMLSHLIVIGCRRAPNDSGKMMPEWEDMAAVACAVQNLHLQATALGLAGYWSSFPAEAVRNDPEFKAGINLESDDICMGVFFLGRSDAADSYRSKRGPVEQKVFWQR